MNRILTTTLASFAASLIGAFFAAPALAVDLNIYFTGKFIEPTCNMTLQDVDLGNASVDKFSGSFQGAWHPVPIRFSGCADLTSRATLSFSGKADANVPEFYEGMVGVGVELRVQPNGSVLGPGSTAPDVAITGGAGAASYVARMSQTAPGVSPGIFSTPVTVSVTYF